MGKGLVLWRRRPRRRVWGALLAALLAVCCWQRARLRAGALALAARADAALAEHLLPGYAARLEALQGEAFDLRLRLAAAADATAENQALRTLLGSGARPAGDWQPVRVAARGDDGGLTLAAELPPGTPVLDAQGRLAGVVRESGARCAAVDAAGRGAGAAAAAAGTANGVLARRGGRLWIEDLPRHSGLTPGMVVATADGLWVGTVAAEPEPDATGLRERAPLADTAEAGVFCFVPKM